MTPRTIRPALRARWPAPIGLGRPRPEARARRVPAVDELAARSATRERDEQHERRERPAAARRCWAISAAPTTSSTHGTTVATGMRARRVRRACAATPHRRRSSIAPATTNSDARAATRGDDRATSVHGVSCASSSTTRPSRAANTSTPIVLAAARWPRRRVDRSCRRRGWGRGGTGPAAGRRPRPPATPRTRRCSGPTCAFGELRRRVLGVVDQQVDAVAQLEHAVGDAAHPSTRLLVVADVGDARAARA